MRENSSPEEPAKTNLDRLDDLLERGFLGSNLLEAYRDSQAGQTIADLKRVLDEREKEIREEVENDTD